VSAWSAALAATLASWGGAVGDGARSPAAAADAPTARLASLSLPGSFAFAATRDTDEAVVWRALLSSPSRLELSLSGNADVGRALPAAVAGPHPLGLRELRLAACRIGVRPGEVAALCAVVEACASLVVLDVGGNPLGDDGATAVLASASRACAGLRDVGLANTHIGPQAVLRWTQRGGPLASEAPFAGAAPPLAALHSLDVSRNPGLADVGAGAARAGAVSALLHAACGVRAVALLDASVCGWSGAEVAAAFAEARPPALVNAVGHMWAGHEAALRATGAVVVDVSSARRFTDAREAWLAAARTWRRD
jgi:hypothetical protein